MNIIKHNVVLPSMGKMSLTFHNMSATIFQVFENINEITRQKETKHLGLISTVFESAAHSRYEYLMLQCALSEVLDNLFSGSPNLAQGELSLGHKKHYGNALLKSWFMLSNLGHTKHTIADEKSLLLFASKQKGFKSTLLSPIKDKDLLDWSQQTIDDFNYTSFHHILSIRRIYKEINRQLDKKEEILEVYKLLLLPIEKVNKSVNIDKLLQLRRLYNTIRAISIVTIDGHYSYFPVSIDLMSTLMSVDAVEHTFSDKFLFDSIKPILSILHEELYLDKQVLAKQRAYELAALKYMNEKPKNPISYETIINEAIAHGLVDKNVKNFEHFARLEIKKSMQLKTLFIDEFRNIRTVKRECKGVEAYLDYNPFTNVRYADFFIDEELFSLNKLPRYTYNISKLIENQIHNLISNTNDPYKALLHDVKLNALKQGIAENMINDILGKSTKTISSHIWKSFKKDIFPSYRQLFWSILNYFIDDKYLLDIDSNDKEYDIFSLKFPDADLVLIKDNIDKAIEIELDPDRQHELKHLWYESKRKFNGYVYVCLSRITIYDPTKPPSHRKVSDIDSASIKISQDEIIIDLIESKNTSKGRENKAVKDLRKNITSVLNRERAKGYSVKKSKGFGGKLRIKIKNE